MIHPSADASFRPSLRPSVRWSVGDAFMIGRGVEIVKRTLYTTFRTLPFPFLLLTVFAFTAKKTRCKHFTDQLTNGLRRALSEEDGSLDVVQNMKPMLFPTVFPNSKNERWFFLMISNGSFQMRPR